MGRRQSRRQGRRQGKKLGVVGGLGLGAAMGAAAMYFFDPTRGPRRRASVADKLLHYTHRTGDELGKAQRDLQHRTRGVIAQVESFGRDGAALDQVIEARVRSRLGRVSGRPGALSVTVQDGVATLSGPILRHELHRVLGAIAAVPGVRGVHNHLEVHDTPGAISGLQTGREPLAARFEFFQANWTPAARVFAVAAGAGLLVVGVAKRGVMGALAGVSGAGFAIRGISNTPWRRLLGIQSGRQAVTFQKEIDVRAPMRDVYAIWSHFENFPLFMQHVRDVQTRGRDLSHWVVRGPAETTVSWDAITTKMIPERIIAWKTLPGAPIASAGVVTFRPNKAGGTRIDIKLSYNPPAGALGNLLATLFAADPKQEMDDDLLRFKSLIEDGKTTVRGQRVTLAQVIGRAGQPPRPGLVGPQA